MSLLDSIKANTIGVIYSAFTGNVDPYTAKIQQDEVNAAIARAGQGLNPAVVQAQQDQAKRDAAAALNAAGANPYNSDGSLKAGLNIPGLGVVGSVEFLKKLEWVVYAGLFVFAIGGVAYFSYSMKRALK